MPDKLYYMDLMDEPKLCEGGIVNVYPSGNVYQVQVKRKIYDVAKHHSDLFVRQFGSPSRTETLAKYIAHCNAQIADHERAIEKLRDAVRWAEGQEG